LNACVCDVCFDMCGASLVSAPTAYFAREFKSPVGRHHPRAQSAQIDLRHRPQSVPLRTSAARSLPRVEQPPLRFPHTLVVESQRLSSWDFQWGPSHGSDASREDFAKCCPRSHSQCSSARHWNRECPSICPCASWWAPSLVCTAPAGAIASGDLSCPQSLCDSFLQNQRLSSWELSTVMVLVADDTAKRLETSKRTMGWLR